MADQAWVTLATNDSYALGALVVSRSLKRVNTTRQLVVMVTPGVSGAMRTALSSEFNLVYDVNVLDSHDAASLALLTRPELGITFTKLHCWMLTQFSKCVFLDADTLVLQNCDELFDRQELSAAPDVGWPDCFNSGVFVFKPSLETFNALLAFSVASGSFDGGDQGLLNLFFADWSTSEIGRHLPFIYNMVASATYSYAPAFKVFGANVKIVHFIGPEKPWLMYFDSSTGTVRAPSGQEHLQALLQSWWDIFRADVRNKLSPDMVGESADSSATVAEQVQDSFLNVCIENHNASSEYVFSSQSQPHHHTHQPQSEEQPPPFHWVSVAIERNPPEPWASEPEPSPEDTSSSNKSPQTPPPENIDPISGSESLESSEIEGFAGLAGAFAKISFEGSKSHQQIEFEEQMRKAAWESGHIDYLGKDSFDNIMKKIHASMSAPAPQPQEAEPTPTPIGVSSQEGPAPAQSTSSGSGDSSEDARLAEERAIIEKKLAEQKRIAEKKLIEEKQAAEERAAAAAAATPPPSVPGPVPPPRRSSKGGK